MSETKDFRSLLVDQLRDLYSAETQLIKALPKMAEAATLPALKAAFLGHLKETKGHQVRLEELFETLDEKPTGKTCAAMKGLISEGDEVAKEGYSLPVRDAGLIAAAQRWSITKWPRTARYEPSHCSLMTSRWQLSFS